MNVNTTQDWQLAFVNAKVDEFVKKAGLKRKPKLRESKQIAPLAVNAARNVLFISERLLHQWQDGYYDNNDVEAMLAHEFGHLVDYGRESWFGKTFKYGIHWYLALLPTIVLLSVLLESFSATIFVVIVLVISCAAWAYCLPWIVRRHYVCQELGADRSAIALNLVSAQQLADSIVKRIGIPPPMNIGLSKTVNFLWSILTHPLIYEQLCNIGFEMKRPIAITRRES